MSSTPLPIGAMPAHKRVRWFTRERLLRYCLLTVGCMWMLPFLLPFKAPPVPSFHAEAAAAALGLVAMIALAAIPGRLQLPRIALLPLGFVGLIVVQLLLGRVPYRETGLLAALYLLWSSGLIVLGGLLRREVGLERVAAMLAWFLLAGALISAVIAWAQHIDSDFLERVMMPRSPDRVWANLGQSNQLADYLSLGLASLAFLYATRRLRTYWVIAAVLALVYILNLTGSRSSYIYLIGLLFVAALFRLSERSEVNRRLLRFCAFAVFAFVAVPWSLGFMESGLSTAIARLAVAEQERPNIWRAAWLMFQEAPLFGVGLHQFGWHHFVLNTQMPLPRVLGFTDNAHNLVLQVMAEFGAIGLMVLLVPAVLWLAGQWRQPRSAALWWLWGIALILTVHSLLEYPLWYTFFLGVASVALGLGEPHTLNLQLGRSERSKRWVVLVGLAFGWFLLWQTWREYLVLENYLAFRYRYMSATPEVERRATRALLEVRRGSLWAPYVELGLARTIAVDENRLQDKLAINGRAMRLFPIDDVSYRQAMLLALRGDQAGARQQWDRSVASFPEVRPGALLVVERRVEDGLSKLQPLRDYARQQK